MFSSLCWLVCFDNDWCWGWGIGRLGWFNIGDWVSLIFDISNISRFGIENIVGDNLDATIRKGNTVSSIGRISKCKNKNVTRQNSLLQVILLY